MYEFYTNYLILKQPYHWYYATNICINRNFKTCTINHQQQVEFKVGLMWVRWWLNKIECKLIAFVVAWTLVCDIFIFSFLFNTVPHHSLIKQIIDWYKAITSIYLSCLFDYSILHFLSQSLFEHLFLFFVLLLFYF